MLSAIPPSILNCSRCAQVLDTSDAPNSWPDGSPDGEDLGDNGENPLCEKAEGIKVEGEVKVEEGEHAGDVSEAESLATTVSLGSPWSPKLRGSGRPADEDMQQVEEPEPLHSKEHVHVEKSKKEFNQRAP